MNIIERWMKGRCCDISDFLCSMIPGSRFAYDIKKVSLTDDGSNRTIYGHCWVEVKNVVIDLTIGQFRGERQLPYIYIGSKSNYQKLFPLY
jgi:hypothetical protein